jgi:hypothetical protein
MPPRHDNMVTSMHVTGVFVHMDRMGLRFEMVSLWKGRVKSKGAS